jgi:hypothetical protein
VHPCRAWAVCVRGVGVEAGLTQAAPDQPAASAASAAAGAPEREGGSWWWVLATIVVGSAVVGGILFWGLRPRAYSQATPEDLLLSVGAMIKDDRARDITNLFYADSVEYRVTLTRLGDLLATVQKLGATTRERFPREVEVLRQQLRKELEGSQSTLLSVLSSPGAARPARGRNQPPVNPDQFQDWSMRLLSDPFGWALESGDRLGVVRVDDDTAVVTFDKQPLLGGIFAMRRIDERWWFVLPLQLPGVSQFAPQTRNEWRIMASLVRVVDNSLRDLERDVAAGKASRLEQVPRLAGEKAFIPTAIVMVMYGKEMDVRTRRERALGEFRRAWGRYVDTRTQADEDRAGLTEVVQKAAVEELDALIRARAADRKAPAPPAFDKLGEEELVRVVEQWLSRQGGALKLDGAVTRAQVEGAGRGIEAKATSGIRARPVPLK